MTVFHRNETRDPLPEHLRGGVVAIGNFDGVHRGHQSVLNRALEEAVKRAVPALVLTFEPHPRTVFRPDTPVFRLTPAPLKARILEGMGFGAVIEYPFDRSFSELSASDFIHSILREWLHASHVVTGFDFHFGKGREGGPAFLMAAGLLGYRYTVEAEVIDGKKLGRTLGYPTANMRLPPEAELKSGIYAVRFRRADGSLHDGVASFGRRPTVDSDGEALLETFVFDFSADLYGEICAVSFFGRLRDELKFDGLEPLMVQMRKDESEARALLAGVQPLSGIDRRLNFA
ncbi:bifunctional riboflavin kinase/FMN adenylyltransferase [Sinorhizobium meliloti]|uniref:bifunctional riboflavin kinase/FMN adenylyltransferase n=1 Tax=Rhizobium meliloti TaxID=382 RepID=UPI000FD905DE|nr:bifunctional riboflavin kinase/FMN adenylyltransferase [Sinorhizobium meliloti]RVH14705.1 bifunctional riboflavin kinase/FMN adenylyltransferase [Sinorhizobium meliloti]